LSPASDLAASIVGLRESAEQIYTNLKDVAKSISDIFSAEEAVRAAYLAHNTALSEEFGSFAENAELLHSSLLPPSPFAKLIPSGVSIDILKTKVAANAQLVSEFTAGLATGLDCVFQKGRNSFDAAKTAIEAYTGSDSDNADPEAIVKALQTSSKFFKSCGLFTSLFSFCRLFSLFVVPHFD
jgi:hypothetical protein